MEFVSGESVNKENGVLNHLNVMKYVFIAQRGVRWEMNIVRLSHNSHF